MSSNHQSNNTIIFDDSDCSIVESKSKHSSPPVICLSDGELSDSSVEIVGVLSRQPFQHGKQKKSINYRNQALRRAKAILSRPTNNEYLSEKSTLVSLGKRKRSSFKMKPVSNTRCTNEFKRKRLDSAARSQVKQINSVNNHDGFPSSDPVHAQFGGKKRRRRRCNRKSNAKLRSRNHYAGGSDIANRQGSNNDNMANASVLSQSQQPGSLRPIVIDGSNIAWQHGENKAFSCKGIEICVNFFKARGHNDVVAFVPKFRLKSSCSTETDILHRLQAEGVLVSTPSREVGKKKISSYDDRFIVQCANANGGVIISNDNFKDLYRSQPEWRETIENRILQYTWLKKDVLIFPIDPLGRTGPNLDKFLRF